MKMWLPKRANAKGLEKFSKEVFIQRIKITLYEPLNKGRKGQEKLLTALWPKGKDKGTIRNG